jgi:indolepyruvate ferredoxin oxidoreductase beta subunit
MQTNPYNLFVIGVGGQGVIRVIQILSWAAMRQGYKVRTAETHGMAQRGGSVTSYLRFGTQVEGPLISRGYCDTILAFEASEAVRYFNYAGPDTTFLINDLILVPPMINQMELDYPSKEEIHSFLKTVSKKIFFIKADELASNIGNPRVMNVIMLGVLLGSGILPLKREKVEEAVIEFVPEKAFEINKKAFQKGYEYGIKISEGLYE